jgi:hypothetical protein
LVATFAVLPAMAAPPSLQGTYTLVPEQSDDVGQAIQNTVAQLNFLFRPIARGRLTKTNKPYQRVILSLSPDEISIITDLRAPIKTNPAGAPIKWTREDGEIFDVSTVWDGTTLKQTFAAEDGQRVNEYRATEDGQGMTLQVTVSSSRLKEPLRYRLAYKRVAAE